MVVGLLTLQRRVSSLMKLIEFYSFSRLSAYRVIVIAFLGSAEYPDHLNQIYDP